MSFLFGLSALVGCNQYELFRVAGFAQEDFSNDADVLFVVDNSSSMQDEAEALALNFDVFIHQITEGEGSAQTTDGLVDAVDNYIAYVQNRSSVVDYQLAITTTDVEATYGALYGSEKILTNDSPDVAQEFDANLLCSATCFLDPLSLPSDPSYTCEDPAPPPGDQLSVQYLDCVCGSGAWEDQCGAGTEEHLEAIFMAMCRAVEDPPDECFENNQFGEEDLLSNDGLLRPDSTLIPILVTDEGDTSRRMPQGDGTPDEYADLFEKFNHRMSFAVIGPTTEVCNGAGATTWGVERLQWFVENTGGRFFPIAEEDGADCVVTDFAAALEELGQLLNSLLDAFVLQAVPDVDTITVFVENKQVEQSSETVEEDGTVTYGEGWSFVAEDNAVKFHGDAVPDYNAEVRIYYRPLEGMPRELPF